MKKQAFLKNAVILTLTSLLLRSVGIFLRIFIAGKIGAEGMGLHTLIFTVYTLAGAVATGGLGIAVTRLTAEDVLTGGQKAVRAVVLKAMPLCLTLGIGSMLLLYACADAIALFWLRDLRTALSLRILSFGLPFMSVSACFKGYFMARRNAKTPSDSQLLEQVIRIAAIVFLLPMAKGNLRYACAAIVLGNSVSEVAACVYLAAFCKRDIRKLPTHGTTSAQILPRLLAVFLPVAFTGYINTALHTAENLLVPQALTRFCNDTTQSLAQFGTLKGMALPLLFFPASFLGALSALLVPEMSEYGAKKQKKSIAAAASFMLGLTFISAMLIAGIFMAYPQEIAALLYKEPDVALYITYLAPIVPFMYLESIATGLLHGLGQQMSTLKYNTVNSALRILCVLLIVPKTGMQGFLWIMIASNLYTSLACLRRLIRVADIRISRRRVLMPVLCLIVALMICHVYNRTGEGVWHMLGGVCLFFAAFGLLSLLTGAVLPSDFSRLQDTRKKQ